MPIYHIRVKWNRNNYEVDANTDEDPDIFRAQLFGLTGVPPERQRIMFKARQLQGDSWEKFTTVGIKDGALFQMMGNSDEIPQMLTQDEAMNTGNTAGGQGGVQVKPPAGLKNLGNTCFLNSTLQLLKSVPEFENALKNYAGQLINANYGHDALTTSMRDLFYMMDNDDEVTPMLFLMLFHQNFPHLATKDEQGRPEQQDANECWVELLRTLQNSNLSLDKDTTGGANLIKQFFRIEMESTLKCNESEDELPQKSTEDFFTFSCFVSQEIKYLHSGLKAKFTEEIVKHSDLLGRDATWTKTSTLSRLPAYLTVTIVRFHYKEKEKINAKIMKDIKFPFALDVFDMCNESLKNRMLPHREIVLDEENKKLERSARIKSGNLEEEVIKSWPKTILPYAFDDDAGSNNTGMYELTAVLTHKGRSSNSGHYVAWVKKNDIWFCCDDDRVYKVLAEDIERLSGGGDWHTAYILLYAPKQVTIINEPATEANAVITNIENTLEDAGHV